MGAKGRRRGRKQAVDPRLSLGIVLGLSLATWSLPTDMRLSLLWVTMVALALPELGRKGGKVSLASANLGRGAVIGLLLAGPVLVLAPETLLLAQQRLYPVGPLSAALLILPILAPVVETLYFRQVLQGVWGISGGVGAHTLAMTLFFLPVVVTFPSVLLALALALALLGFIYSYVRARYGLAAAIGCQAAVNALLFLSPLAWEALPLK
ncbi:MAG: type II CAAX prenyl endopeptidase Rce1 family protein [Anaerolineae bacterium]